MQVLKHRDTSDEKLYKNIIIDYELFGNFETVEYVASKFTEEKMKLKIVQYAFRYISLILELDGSKEFKNYSGINQVDLNNSTVSFTYTNSTTINFKVRSAVQFKIIPENMYRFMKDFLSNESSHYSLIGQYIENVKLLGSSENVQRRYYEELKKFAPETPFSPMKMAYVIQSVYANEDVLDTEGYDFIPVAYNAFKVYDNKSQFKIYSADIELIELSETNEVKNYSITVEDDEILAIKRFINDAALEYDYRLNSFVVERDQFDKFKVTESAILKFEKMK